MTDKEKAISLLDSEPIGSFLICNSSEDNAFEIMYVDRKQNSKIQKITVNYKHLRTNDNGLEEFEIIAKNYSWSMDPEEYLLNSNIVYNFCQGPDNRFKFTEKALAHIRPSHNLVIGIVRNLKRNYGRPLLRPIEKNSVFELQKMAAAIFCDTNSYNQIKLLPAPNNLEFFKNFVIEWSYELSVN